MRTLMFHCRNYSVKIGKLANRPKGIKPEEIKEKEQHCKDCVVVLLTVETNDHPEKIIPKLTEEIEKASRDTGHKNIVLLPFAHLSKNLASSDEAIKTIDLLEAILSEDKNLKVIRGHFGSDKELMIDVFGHKGNARYREFY
ncbi:MAG: threonyl-tRNA synthetase editing domain-containing protein [Candidatus Nanoarchaeia archaeon]